MKLENFFFLSGNGNHNLGYKILNTVSELMGNKLSFSHINYNNYLDGEPDNRIVSYKEIENKTVVFYQSMYNQELMNEALDFIAAVKHQYKARYVIAIFPFLYGRRQDPIMNENEKDEPWSKKIAKPDEIQRLENHIRLLKTVGVNEMMVATPHSSKMAKLCDQYEIIFHEIDPSPLFAKTIRTFIPDEDIELYSPDLGSLQRATKLASILRCPIIFNEKKRLKNNTISIVENNTTNSQELENELRKYYNFPDIHCITPELISEKNIIIVEDEVSSGSTANNTGLMLREKKAKSIMLFATHPVLTDGWRNQLFLSNPFTKIVMTDTIDRGYKKRTGGLITDVSVASLFGSSLFKLLNKLEK